MHLFQVVLINVVVTEGINEFADFKVADMCYEVSQQRIRADIERNAQKRIGRTLVELAVKCAFACDFELKQCMTWRQVNVVTLARVPATDDWPARVWVGFDLVD